MDFKSNALTTRPSQLLYFLDYKMTVKFLRKPCSLSNVSNPIGSEKSTSLEVQHQTSNEVAEIRRQRFKLDYGKIRILVGWEGGMGVYMSDCQA